jgi:hypothetical protein
MTLAAWKIPEIYKLVSLSLCKNLLKTYNKIHISKYYDQHEWRLYYNCSLGALLTTLGA